MKDNSLEVVSLLPQAKYLLYQGNRPFLKTITDAAIENNIKQDLKWFSYSGN